MGQYYKAIILRDSWEKYKQPVVFAMSSWLYECGSKLMEHSWAGNPFMRAIEWLLANEYYGFNYVHCGDYADNLRTKGFPLMAVRNRYGEKLPEKCDNLAYVKEVLLDKYDDLFKRADNDYDPDYTAYITYNEEVWANLEKIDGIEVDNSLNLYSQGGKLIEKAEKKGLYKCIPDEENIPYYKYAVNFTKKEYVIIPKYKPNKWQMHPLSLLCANSNGKGCGDYHEIHDEHTGDLIPNDYDKVGIWAYDKIGITNDKNEVKGFTELKVNFREDF